MSKTISNIKTANRGMIRQTQNCMQRSWDHERETSDKSVRFLSAGNRWRFYNQRFLEDFLMIGLFYTEMPLHTAPVHLAYTICI